MVADLLLSLTTHGLVAVMFFLLGRIVTIRAARRWPDRPHLEDVMHAHGEHEGGRQTGGGPNRKGESQADGEKRRSISQSNRLSVALIAASLFVVAIGVQAYVEKQDQGRDDAREDAQVACFEKWGEDMVDTITTRTGAKRAGTSATGAAGSIDLERATQRRDRALDQIILTVIAFREIPPQADDADFDRVLEEYAAAIRNLERVSADVDATRADNPYPELHC